MNKSNRFLILQREIALPKWVGVNYHFKLGTALAPIFRLLCWSAVVWVVWNNALSHFLNAGSIGPLLSLGLGAFVYAVSMVLDDHEC